MSQIIANAIVSTAMYVLVGLSFSLIYTTSRFFNFAHAGYIIAAPYLAYFLAITLGVGWPLALAVGVITGSVVAIALDALIFQPLIKRKAPASMALLASLGLYVAIEATISLVFGSASLSFGLSESSIVELAGARLTSVQILSIVAAVACAASIWVFLHCSTAGKLIRAVGDDRELVSISGADPMRASLAATGLGATIAGIAGSLNAADTGLTPAAGFPLLLGGVVAMVIGGIGSTSGLLLGAVLVAVLEHGAQWWISSAWERLILFGILLAFLLLRPEGILGEPSRAGSA